MTALFEKGGLKVTNGINERQNSERNIILLAAQRQLYNEAKTLDISVLILSVVLPFILSVVILFFGNSFVKGAAYISATASWFISMLFRPQIINKKSLAASIQLLSDTYVFDMPLDESCFEVSKSYLKSVISEKSLEIMKNTEKKEKLYNWYLPYADTVYLEKGILFCQKTSIAWDFRLRERYKLFCCGLTLAVISAVICLGLVFNGSLLEFLFRLTFITPLVYWACLTCKGIDRDMIRINKLFCDIDAIDKSDNKIDMADLQLIESNITKHRRECTMIPDYFYSLYRKFDGEIILNDGMIQELEEGKVNESQ